MANDGPTPLERFIRGILPENPVFRQILGTCPTLAVSGSVKNALTMAGATAFVLIFSNLVVSLIRHLLKPHLRILVFTLTIAAFVTIADRFLAAFMYTTSKQLGPYVPLIIVNCIIICRCEVCASKQGPLTAVADAVGNSLGFALGLLMMSSVRELLSTGSWFGIEMFWKAGTPDEQYRWALMALPPGAFLTFGSLMGLWNWTSEKFAKRAKTARAAG